MRAASLLLVLALAGCGDDIRLGGNDLGPDAEVDPPADLGPPDDGPLDLGVDAGVRVTLTVVPDALDPFEHIPRVTPCPQTIGTATLSHDGAAAVSWSVVPPVSYLVATPDRGVLEPRATADVTILFNCMPPFLPDIDEELTFTHDGAGPEPTLRVTGVIR